MNRSGPPRPAPENGVIDHRGDAHAGAQIAPAVAGIAEIVRNDPKDHQHHQKAQDGTKDGADGGSQIAPAFRGIAAGNGAVAVPHGGNIVFLHGNAVAIFHIVDEGVEGAPHRRVIIPCDEVLLHVLPKDIGEGILLAGAPAAAPAHIIVAAGLAVIVVLQRQHQQHAVIALGGTNTQPFKLLLGVVGDVLAAGGVDDLHGDLGAGLGKERGVHGVNICGCFFGNGALGVVDILVGANQGGAGLLRIHRLARLAQGDAQDDPQDHHHSGNGAFLK